MSNEIWTAFIYGIFALAAIGWLVGAFIDRSPKAGLALLGYTLVVPAVGAMLMGFFWLFTILWAEAG
ncbi:hypothetical protein MESS2_1500021 [Mesorhizobium metallidurans STM 2683]|uniref:Uncharacterized protein n=1 Tax=Mesorhizobium metallidurans STM 2683 TaxID=1297569 RepID=M5F037_9HYPH|nr:hypothetical protein [Mesorhizobium metallidurans]CCV05176.1 hypothetical protein MESS2_1500021 [Mesorhizobium metallidurans STM 2683]